MKYSFAKSFINLSSGIFNEMLIIFLFIFIINNFLSNEDVRINADGKGYYDYLPSIFIYNDFVRFNCGIKECPEKYERIKKMGVYSTLKDKKVDKYTCGTALLESPFFLVTFLANKRTYTIDEAYQPQYQHAIFYSALFYLFLSLYFLKLLLKLYRISPWIITSMQLLIVFATGISYYANYNAGYSHVFSLFAITLFSFMAKKYFIAPEKKIFILAIIVLALVTLIRPTNAVILFFTPFLAGNFMNFKKGVFFLLKKPLILFSGIAFSLLLLSIQPIAWYLQTSSFFLYPYIGEGFNWDDPQFINVLFSYRKGLFVYSPALFVSLLTVIWLFFRKRSFEGLMWVCFFILITYIISSWSTWSYGSSYGMRPYIDYLPVFVIPLALFLQDNRIPVRVLVMGVLFGMAVINQIQTFQYKEYILTWDTMNKQDYWKVFLRTNHLFKDVLWKIKPEVGSFQNMKFDISPPADLIQHSQINLFSSKAFSKNEINRLKFIKLNLTTLFDKKNDAQICFRITDTLTSDTLRFEKMNIMKMLEKEVNTVHEGVIYYQNRYIKEEGAYIISIDLILRNQKINIQNPTITYYFN